MNKRHLPLGLIAAFAALLPALMPMSALAASATATTNVPWYLSRATGLVAYLFLFLTVVFGLAIRTRAFERLVDRWRITDIHTFLSVLVLLFVVVHGLVLLGDQFVGFSLTQVFVPFTASYRPLWTGIGIISAWLLLAIGLSFPLRRFTGYAFWRSLHYLTFVVYIGALVHSVFSGTDSTVGWVQVLYEVTAGIVLVMGLARIASWRQNALATLDKEAKRRSTSSPSLARASSTQGSARDPYGANALLPANPMAERRERIDTRAMLLGGGAIVVALILFLAAGFGPFLWGQSPTTSSASVQSGALALNAGNFQEPYTGTISQGRGGRRGNQVSLQIAAQGQQSANLDVELQYASSQGSSPVVVANNAVLTDNGGTTLCTGQVSSMDTSSFQVGCQGSGPYAGRQLTLTGSIDQNSGSHIQGTLQVSVAPQQG